ncbi:serine/threonine protein kinase [Stieleria sp. TO1_6]|uniref:serine/threonine-protein kinase n=1 Tax=Stieleria tagensis TaxID=2956795 RepID=UPI00209AEE2C|nr:serine/threonine-protein kinase [Stieleria tagensis]MCO8124093.1 serine/threonine protein kinase [Stieleria tagensis]
MERGESIDRDELRQRYPHAADSICRFLDDEEQVQNALADLRSKVPGDTQLLPTVDSKALAATGKPAIGERLKYVGQYEILQEIARGGMGVVFKARQEKLDRIVALKMILCGGLASEADQQRFAREARAAGQLQHPSIVPVHEMGVHAGHPYFTMDFIEGKTLAEILRDNSIAPREAAELVKSVAEAIEFAHARGTLHRDLKPSNILLDAEGRPHVTDFGLAKLIPVEGETAAELTESGQILGTPGYMSPKQASGEQGQVGPTSDVYALGAVLYACLAGRGPFVADSTLETLRQVIHDPPISPRVLNPKVPKDLETICLKCLEKSPRQRYASARELAADLQRFLNNESVNARPLSRLTRGYRWADRNLGKFTALMIVVSLFMPIVIFFAIGALMGRWPPWELLDFSYPVMLVLGAPYLFNMLVYYARVRMGRKAGSGPKEVRQRSVPLIVLGVSICLACVVAYTWVLVANQWKAPKELRLLAVGVILGIGMVVRGLGVRG